MSRILPQKDFPITRNIDDPLATQTLFVRAFIYDAAVDSGGTDDDLLETVDLTDQGDQRFSKLWHSVADPSGEGRYVNIITRVFTDSGYTTESVNFGRESTKYVVRADQKQGGGFLGMRNAGIREVSKGLTKKQVKELFRGEFPKLAKKHIVIPADNTQIVLGEVKKMIGDIIIPQPEKVDLSGIVKLQEGLNSMAKNFEKRMFGIIDALNQFNGMPKEVNKIVDNLRQFFDNDVNKITDAIKSLSDGMDNQTFVSTFEKIKLPNKNKQEVKKSRKHLFKRR